MADWKEQWDVSTLPKKKGEKVGVTVSRCTNYTGESKTDASGKTWPPVVWQSYISEITAIVNLPQYTGGPYTRSKKTKYYDVLVQENCTPYSTGGISYSTIQSGDVVAASSINSIVRSVNNELTRRGLTSSVSTVSTRETAYATSLAAIGDAIRKYEKTYNNELSSWFGQLQWDTKSIVTPNESDVIQANQPTSITNVLSCMIRECVCYTDCISYYICRCYSYCNYY